MVREMVEVVRCNVCHQNADTYKITAPEGEVELDLCGTHARPLMKIYAQGEPVTEGRRVAQPPQKATAGRRSRQSRVELVD